jgi:hypothetical protein
MPEVVLRSIRPKEPPLDPAEVRRQLGKELQGRIKDQGLALARRTVSNWRTRVDFNVRFFTRSDSIGFTLTAKGPNAQIWNWVSEGTRGHMVAPVRAKALRFRAQYRAKTRPGRINPRAGGARGPFVYSKGHWVRGITARNFPKAIAKGMRKNFAREINNAIRRAARRR